MAAGIYYTQADYEARYGEEELLRLADEAGDGSVDTLILGRAIADASADMDAYLARRYELPIATPLPRLLVSIAGSLVREKLHVAFPTETVTLEANRARSQLKDLANGIAQLTIDATGDSAAAGSAVPSGIKTSAPSRRFTDATLDKF